MLVVALVWIERSGRSAGRRVAATILFIGVATLWTLIVVSNARTVAVATG